MKLGTCSWLQSPAFFSACKTRCVHTHCDISFGSRARERGERTPLIIGFHFRTTSLTHTHTTHTHTHFHTTHTPPRTHAHTHTCTTVLTCCPRHSSCPQLRNPSPSLRPELPPSDQLPSPPPQEERGPRIPHCRAAQERQRVAGEY